MGNILYIVMPAYNEEANIEEVIRAWYEKLEYGDEKSTLLVADSGSSDNTHRILCDLQMELPRLEIISDTDRFHGPKLVALYDYALSKGADYIFQTDSDGQTSPEEFRDFWDIRENYSAIFGYRVSRGDGLTRAFVEKVVCLLLKLYFGIKVPDANAPFRLMQRDALSKYIGRIPKDYALTNIMLTAFFAFFNEPISFRKVSFNPRKGGKSALNMGKIIKIGVKALREFGEFKAEMLNNQKRG